MNQDTEPVSTRTSPSVKEPPSEGEIWRALTTFRSQLGLLEAAEWVLALIHLARSSASSEVRSAGLPNPWSELRQSTAGFGFTDAVVDALSTLEDTHPQLAGVLPRATPDSSDLDAPLGELVELIAGFALDDESCRVLSESLASLLSRSMESVGYMSSGSAGRVLVEMLAPVEGRVRDPCCGFGELLGQAAALSRARGTEDRILLEGLEVHPSLRKLAVMSLSLRSIDARIEVGDVFSNLDRTDLEADYVIAFPPWGQDVPAEILSEAARWPYGTPNPRDSHSAWLQVAVEHLSASGFAGMITLPSSLFGEEKAQHEIRSKVLEADLVDCIVTLPGNLLPSASVPLCLWILARDKKDRSFKERQGQVLFLDARDFGKMVDRRCRSISDDETHRLASTFHAWRGDSKDAEYADVAGFCRSVAIEEIRQVGYLLLPARYVGEKPAALPEQPLEETIVQLKEDLNAQLTRSAQLGELLKSDLERLSF